MQSCLDNLHLQNCIVCLDDIIIFSEMPKVYSVRLRTVFEWLKQAGLKLKPLKCEFFKWKADVLRPCCIRRRYTNWSQEGGGNPWKWPIPTNVTEVHSFLGFTNYYSKFIKKYAQVARPLYKLISGRECSKKMKFDEVGSRMSRSFWQTVKSCALAHQFWHMWISRNCLGYIQMQAFLAWSSFISGTRWCWKGYQLCQSVILKIWIQISSPQVGISLLKMGNNWPISWISVWKYFWDLYR